MLDAAKLSPRERAELVMKAPVWKREPNDEEWTVFVCPRCSFEVILNNQQFKASVRGRVMLPCIYCGAYSRKPGLSVMKIERLFR